MSLLGKLLAILNVLAAVAFVAVAGLDWAQRQRWAYSVYRYDLSVQGLPLDEKEKDADGNPRVDKLTDTTLAAIFRGDSAGPVQTQLKEVNRVSGLVKSTIDAPDAKGNKTQKLAHSLVPLARTYPQREALLRQQGDAGTRTNELSLDLNAAFADVLETQGVTQGGRDVVRGVRPKEGEAQPGEVAVKFVGFDSNTGLLSTQVGGEVLTFSVPSGQPVAGKDGKPLAAGADVYVTVPTAEKKLQEVLDWEIKAATQGEVPRWNPDAKTRAPVKMSLEEHKAACARLLFGFGEALHDDANTDFLTSPAFNRLITVVGLRGVARAVDAAAVATQQMTEEVLAHRDAELQRFIYDHNQRLSNDRNLSDAVERLKGLLKAKEDDVLKQKQVVELRQTQITELKARLKGLQQVTSDTLAEQAKTEQEIMNRLIELRNTAKENLKLELEIREREEALNGR